jgi:Flp pilus assembly protein TadB
VKLFLLVALACFGFGVSSPADSMRLVQLETQLKAMQQEKEAAAMEKQRQEQERNLARITTLETTLAGMAKRQATLDNDALWTAGDKMESSVWLSLAGGGCYALAVLGAQGNSPGLALIGLGGAATFNIMSIVKTFGAGTSLKRASSP